MSVIRVAGYGEGSSLAEPINWILYDTETKEQTVEWNPKYVPPAPQTEIDRVRDEIWLLKKDLNAAEEYLAALEAE